ncbi:hypothetical protein QE152_g34176 [Popillia japonica]|uniref:Uncharacterized protein n=1 Tax=Popillia japonica TaxID=7064 RepID=A0AAW1ITY9_POPJA
MFDLSAKGSVSIRLNWERRESKYVAPSNGECSIYQRREGLEDPRKLMSTAWVVQPVRVERHGVLEKEKGSLISARDLLRSRIRCINYSLLDDNFKTPSKEICSSTCHLKWMHQVLLAIQERDQSKSQLQYKDPS